MDLLDKLASSDPPLNKSELAIVIIMRVIGVCGLLAIPAICLPYSWISAIHEYVGLSKLLKRAIDRHLSQMRGGAES